MRRQDFHYDLPQDLIAQFPPEVRGDSRLLCLEGNSGELQDRHFSAIEELLQAGDLLVFNDTRVMPARLYGRKRTGGRVELLIERVLDLQRGLAHIRASKSPKPGTRIEIADDLGLEVISRQDDLFEVRSDGIALTDLMESHGHIPLPPYIEREDREIDVSRYQTVYAQRSGAVAAPTAGLHFTEELLQMLKSKGVLSASVTLHVGAGTFQPVRVDNLAEHRMHSESVEVGEETCRAVRQARAEGRRVVAVGTTSVRSLEAASGSGEIAPFFGDTRLFIQPGYRFRSIDAMITNFHLPESTLLMLVSAFSGYQQIMRAYQHAVQQRYRFFSYGDAMFLTRRDVSDGEKNAR